MINQLLINLSELPEVIGIALGGSRATNTNDDMSDYDIYVYLNSPLDESKRRLVIDPYVSYMEYSNHFWELEDDGILHDGIEIEFIYREISVFEEFISGLDVGHGYSTCFVDNILSCIILYEEDNVLSNLKSAHSNPFQGEYIQRLVNYNYPLIKDQIPALLKQVKKAVARQDLHAINHRLTEYFAIYHDILFAINKETHKGEKRLLEITNQLPNVPKDQEKLVQDIYSNAFTNPDRMIEALTKLSIHLESLLKELGYIY